MSKLNLSLLSVLSFFVFDCLTGLNLSALTVEEAYRLIPHKRTIFDYNTALMSESEKFYLSEIFRITDLATVERVNMLIWLRSGGQKGRVSSNYDNILMQLEYLEPSQKLLGFHNIIIQSIMEQRKALNVWKSGSFSYSNLRFDPLVKSSSAKLKKAYSILMREFPKENKHNKQAFFDHLCALDFI